ncbi:MAG: peptidase, partial [Gemmatimonadetes bacterium]|nr:peptidase [Gemmatimonadota bacterium]
MPKQPMLIIDGHLDLAFNALHHRRDLTQDVHVLREREDPKPVGPSHPDSLRDRKRPASSSRGTATVSLPQMRQGCVGIALSTIMCRVQMPTGLLDDGMRTQEAAHAMGQSHLHYYKALEREGQLRFIRDTNDLDAAIAAWQNPDSTTPIGLILSMESADPILDPEQVSWWWEQGLRSVGLTHFGANTWGHGTGTRGGLYADAYPLLDALDATNIALDLTHASDLVFWQLLDYWQGPVHASHCNCRALVPGQRHLSDEMIQAIAERGGVIGAVFAEFMLNP